MTDRMKSPTLDLLRDLQALGQPLFCVGSLGDCFLLALADDGGPVTDFQVAVLGRWSPSASVRISAVDKGRHPPSVTGDCVEAASDFGHFAHSQCIRSSIRFFPVMVFPSASCGGLSRSTSRPPARTARNRARRNPAASTSSTATRAGPPSSGLFSLALLIIPPHLCAQRGAGSQGELFNPYRASYAIC